MSDDPKPEDEQEVLKTFDMYRFFSRVDVILVIAVLLFVLGYLAYRFVFSAPVIT